MKKEPVFCANCQYFKPIKPLYTCTDNYIPERCCAPGNTSKKLTYKRRITVYDREPRDINAHNDCIWYLHITAADNTLAEDDSEIIF